MDEWMNEWSQLLNDYAGISKNDNFASSKHSLNIKIVTWPAKYDPTPVRFVHLTQSGDRYFYLYFTPWYECCFRQNIRVDTILNNGKFVELV